MAVTLAGRIGVLVASRNAGRRAFLTGILKRFSDIDVLGSSDVGPEMIERAKHLSPRVVVMDRTATRDHMQIADNVMSACPGIKVVLLEEDDDERSSDEVTGLVGVIESMHTSATPTELADAVKSWRFDKTSQSTGYMKGGEGI